MQASAETHRSRVFDALFADYRGSAFAVRLWDGWCWRSSQDAQPKCTIRITTPSALELLLDNPDEIFLGEAFVRGDLDVTGDIFSVFTVGEHVLGRPATVRRAMFRSIMAATLRIGRFLHDGGTHSRNRDSAAIAHHYDQPFQFYKLWLGKTLTYSCAYFRTGDEDLDQAQHNKLDLICRKLRLQPCDQFLDIGCGWASLLLHAASSYGVYAHGITLPMTREDWYR